MPVPQVLAQKASTAPEGKPPAQHPAPVRVAGHVGELLQGRLGPKGPVVLVTLPCPVLAVTAEVRPGPFALIPEGEVALEPGRAARFLQALRLPLTGRFTLRGGLPPGGGAGASTAALVALARAAGAEEERIAAACVGVEGASDPLMLRRPGQVLWASRQGRVVAELPALPQMQVLAGFHGPMQRTDPADARFPDVADLVALWPQACGDAAQLARLAGLSAQRTLALRGPAGDRTEALAQATGARGFAIGHTGPARALLFSAGEMPEGAVAAVRAAGWQRVVSYGIGGAEG